MQFVDHTPVVEAIRKQNWKMGGALCMDIPEAETAVLELVERAAKIIHARCLAAAEEAAKTGNAQRVVDAVRYTSDVV